MVPLLGLLMGIDHCQPRDQDDDGWTPLLGDCDDQNPDIHPGAPELCNGIDNNCNGDEGFDSDADGLADCFDVEECDGLDNDGDGEVDEGFDVDGDGVADCEGARFCSSEDGRNVMENGSAAVVTWDEYDL